MHSTWPTPPGSTVPGRIGRRGAALVRGWGTRTTPSPLAYKADLLGRGLAAATIARGLAAATIARGLAAATIARGLAAATIARGLAAATIARGLTATPFNGHMD